MQRNFFEIISEILQVAKNGAKKTRIMYSCNLSHRMTQSFLNFLLESDLLRKASAFHTTEKGLQFVEAYQNLELLMNPRN